MHKSDRARTKHLFIKIGNICSKYEQCQRGNVGLGDRHEASRYSLQHTKCKNKYKYLK